MACIVGLAVGCGGRIAADAPIPQKAAVRVRWASPVNLILHGPRGDSLRLGAVHEATGVVRAALADTLELELSAARYGSMIALAGVPRGSWTSVVRTSNTDMSVINPHPRASELAFAGLVLTAVLGLAYLAFLLTHEAT